MLRKIDFLNFKKCDNININLIYLIYKNYVNTIIK